MISTRTFFRKEKDLLYAEGLQVGKGSGEAIGEAKAKMEFVKILKNLGHKEDVISEVLNIPKETIA